MKNKESINYKIIITNITYFYLNLYNEKNTFVSLSFKLFSSQITIIILVLYITFEENNQYLYRIYNDIKLFIIK